MPWLLLTLKLAFGEPAATAATSIAIPWDALERDARQAFDRGPGRAYDTQIEGSRDARKAVSLPIDSIFAQFQPDTAGGSPLNNFQAALQFTIGDRRGTSRRMWDANTVVQQSERASAAFTFVQQVQSAWLDAWVAWEMAEHLDAFADELHGLVAPLEQATQSGVLAQSELDTIEVEIARLHAEAGTARLASRDAEIEIARTLGHPASIDPSGMPDLENTDALAFTNPWSQISTKLEEHPAIRALAAQQQLAEKQAAAARWSTVATLGLGAGVLQTPAGKVYTTPLAILTIPLRNPEAPLAKYHDAQARALDSEMNWQIARLRAEIGAKSAAWDAAITRVRELATEVEKPLRDRFDHLQNALVHGAVGAMPVNLALRDLHEAHHTHALAIADLIARRAQAEAIADALQTETSP